MGLLLKKNHDRTAFSSYMNWGSYIASIVKTGALFHSMKFLSPKIALYLYKSTI